MSDFTHMKSDGSSKMVDVSGKDKTMRRAVASGRVSVSGRVIDLIRGHKLPKGSIFEVARLAGVMGAKQTSNLIPLCHQVPLDVCKVEIAIDEGNSEIVVGAEVRARWSTGVEMEALVAVSIAALTVYDMVKAVDRGAVIGNIRLLEKSGGKSGDYGGG